MLSTIHKILIWQTFPTNEGRRIIKCMLRQLIRCRMYQNNNNKKVLYNTHSARIHTWLGQTQHKKKPSKCKHTSSVHGSEALSQCTAKNKMENMKAAIIWLPATHKLGISDTCTLCFHFQIRNPKFLSLSLSFAARSLFCLSIHLFSTLFHQIFYS